MRSLSIARALLLTAITLLPVFAAQGVSAQVSPQLGEILKRMQAADNEIRTRVVPYSATRRYELSDVDARTPNSQVVAEINFVPPAQKEYTIRKIAGSDRGEKIVRKVLDHEAEMTSHRDRAELTDTNYEFALAGTSELDGHWCYVIELKPRRSSTELLRGRAWVDAETYLVRKIDGQPAKNPSWWVRDVHITINYGPADGMWMPLATRAVADVRLLGKHVLTSENVDVRTAIESARTQPAARVAPHRSNPRRAATAAGVWVSR